MIKKVAGRFQRLVKLIAVNFSVLASFIELKFLFTPMIVYASDTDQFSLKAPKNGDSFQVITSYINQRIPAIQGLSAVILILACIGCGTRLGISSAFGDPRGRQEALMGIFWIIVAGILVIHARQIVGMGAS